MALTVPQGEISGLVNLFRTLGGFSVAYFQVVWATRNGALQTFGCEAAIVAGMFLLIVPLLQWKGRSLRVSHRQVHKRACALTMISGHILLLGCLSRLSMMTSRL